MKLPKCPECGNANAVGLVSCCSTSKNNYTKKVIIVAIV